jgi:hypothetical protein
MEYTCQGAAPMNEWYWTQMHIVWYCVINLKIFLKRDG